MANPRRTPSQKAAPEGDGSTAPITLLGSYQGADALAIVLDPERFHRLFSLGLDEGEFELPSDPAAAAKTVDEWIEWALATYPEYVKESALLSKQLKKTKRSLKTRKSEVRVLLKQLVVRVEEEADGLEEEKALTLDEQVSAAIGRFVEIMRSAFFPSIYNNLPAGWQVAVHKSAAIAGLDLEAIHGDLLISAPGAVSVTGEPAPSLDPASEPTAAPEPQPVAAAEEPAAEFSDDVPQTLPTLTEALREEPATRQLPAVDATAKQLHDTWARKQQEEGKMTVFNPRNENLLVPYENLSEEARGNYRTQVEAVYAAIAAAESGEQPASQPEQPVEAPEGNSEPENSSAEATQ